MKRFIAIIIIGVLSFGGNWMISLTHGMPVPHVHDEFSYLLASDTFAHGRLTNPTHPMWQHFETFYVLQNPTYMSMYPPAQGFFMAVGQVLFGHPIYGVWISSSLMCMAICWMLYAWVPAYWAFIGGVVSVLEFGVFTYWSQSYWGGAVAALGGALVFGALPRIFKYQRLRDVIWLGLGIALIVNSRPLEGILLGIPVGCLILPWKIKWATIKNFYFVKKIVLPFILILMVIVIGVGAYNKAVTGSAFIFPSLFYQKNFMANPLFIWQPVRPIPAYRHQAIRSFFIDALNKYYLEKRTWKGLLTDEFVDINRIFIFYFGYVLAIPIVFFLPRFLVDGQRATKFFLVSLILAATCAVTSCPGRAHYFSPITCLAVLLVVLGLRSSVGLLKHKIWMMVNVLIALGIIINILILVKPVWMESKGKLAQGQGIPFEDYTREQFKDLLMQKGGKHLVLVKQVPHMIFRDDWVFNTANIDQQPIIWARDMNDKEDMKLLAYFKDRQVWRITLDKEIYLHLFRY